MATAQQLNHLGDPQKNEGHGYVFKRADGRKEACGGPEGGCKVCREELEQAKQPHCPDLAITKPTSGHESRVLGCSKPGRHIEEGGVKRVVCNHHGSHDHSRDLGNAQDFFKCGPINSGANTMDRVALTQAGVPWFSCGMCGFSGPFFKGVDAQHKDCEAKKFGYYVAPTFDEKHLGMGYTIFKTSEGSYGIAKYEPGKEGTAGTFHMKTKDESWDDTVLKLTALVGDDMPISALPLQK